MTEAEQIHIKIKYRNSLFEVPLSVDSRLSQLVAQFHLNCCNIEGNRVSLKYEGKRINNLSQRIIDAVSHNLQPTIQLVASRRVIMSGLNNCRFYEDELRPPGLLMTIEQLLQCKQNYTFLEQCHDYIQWLFPTSFKSTFNELSHVLTEEEAQEFRRNGIIGKRMYRAYHMFMDFLGVQVVNTTGDLNIISLQRMELALVHNVHNHLRIRRMMACLSVVGFRRLALKFLAFLERVIKSYFPGKLDMIFMSSWSKYSNKNITNALKNCGIDNVSVFEEENPYIQDLTDTPYSFWKGYPDSEHSLTINELLQDKQINNLFFHIFEKLFPLNSRDIEDIRTIYGYDKKMDDITAKVEIALKEIQHSDQYLLTIRESLKMFGLERFANRFTSTKQSILQK